jgi:hypothetical protein
LAVGGDFEAEAAVQPGLLALTAGAFTPLGGAPGGPGDGPVETGITWFFCAETAAENVKVDIRHGPTNTIVWRGEFAALGACPA